ncbi:glycoside hydrolase family 9 protein [Parabacteroides sp. Marseille-P3160]|uniref:glycoside hydrolase family 9 protein n=1 Tax=Parabacteroides sp. Marseille-P3160 TaxID=1917887 RepID=UPI0009BB7CE7|nr:glycoside hydrolase family 9 protein [Parabacteroides sp. Marseille-P3160]
MKKSLHFLLFFITVCGNLFAQEQSWIRINQLGYLPYSAKVAVFLSKEGKNELSFFLKDAQSDQIVFTGKGKAANANRWGMKEAYRLPFSEITADGEYYIECNGVRSPRFKISPDVYRGTADFLLNYMRQQRCGYNPYLDHECHQHDGYIVDHPTRTGEFIDVRGGWHDASDYLQYLTTSANATFQMMFAWQQTPDKTIFQDAHDASGKKGSNGIPDIIDEIRWGLEWMVRMNPDSAVMFNQIADDRDHAGMRIPTKDDVDYGWGKGTGRPVYPVTGKPQGLGKHKNRSTGVSSSAAKFASAFTLGADLFKEIDPAFSEILREKALPAYLYGKAVPGNNQTACTVSPYFYEEDNWVDDMELAAAVRYQQEGDAYWLKEADYWGQLEEITPWMELGRARHYQFYPFVNLGHYYLSQSGNPGVSAKYTEFMRHGLEALSQRAKEQDDPFLNGIPFIWCSNNLVAAAITQARLYYQTSGDDTYKEMEAALRDWLFGCNPWGTSMICGLPATGDSPTQPHSFVSELMNDIPYGGLVDGPIYKSTYESLLGIHLKHEDPYAPFQQGAAVYHDDSGDYSSNEPTMDGTASLSFYLSTMEKTGNRQQGKKHDQADAQGAIVRHRTNQKAVYLIFSADETFEGASSILKTLKKHKAKASFFLTGNCLRNPRYEPIIRQIIKQGHYVGGHSDKHILYASWENRDSLLVSKDSLVSDFRQNMKELAKFGVDLNQVEYYLPPYEWYNRKSVRWIENEGQTTINFTPGILTAADYTTPDMPNYRSSQELIDQLYQFERKEGLNGAVILLHPGTQDIRTDKLYLRLDGIIQYLKQKGYLFESFKN